MIDTGFVGFLTTDFTQASSNAPLKATVRVPDSRKLLDGSWGSAFKDITVWPDSRPGQMVSRLAKAGKPMGNGSHVAIRAIEREEEYEQDGKKRIGRTYEVVAMSFVSSGSKKQATDESTDTTSDGPHGYDVESRSGIAL